MQVNSTSQNVAAQTASSTTAQTQSTPQEQAQAVAEPQTLQDDTVSISPEAQDMQAFSGSGGGTWPTVKPK